MGSGSQGNIQQQIGQLSQGQKGQTNPYSAPSTTGVIAPTSTPGGQTAQISNMPNMSNLSSIAKAK